MRMCYKQSMWPISNDLPKISALQGLWSPRFGLSAPGQEEKQDLAIGAVVRITEANLGVMSETEQHAGDSHAKAQSRKGANTKREGERGERKIGRMQERRMETGRSMTRKWNSMS